MAYTTINKPSEYFNTKLFTGNGSTQSITGVGHQPDLVWIKHRNNATLWNHSIHDSVRGSTKYIPPNTTNQELTDVNSVTSFDNDGFSIGTFVKINDNGVNHVAWNWKANGSGVSNTDGSITSTVSASTTSGFSIVTWTGNSGSVGHGLGKKPEMIISKSLGASGAWYTTHKSLSTEMQDNYMFLNTTDANTTNNDIWGGEPTTSTFSVGSGLIGNTTHVAYCFNSVKGFSKIGSYVGNGNADGTFIYTGFKPAFVIIKNSSSTGAWYMQDNKRDVDNPIDLSLNASDANADNNQGNIMDFLSNGIKIRNTGTGYNSSGATYIYMAFAENPLVGTNGIPATAR